MTRVLLVDDDARFRRTLHLALTSRGYEVTEVADGKAALKSFSSNVPDLVVLDWHMPGMDGIETCRALRASSDVPVIMISANRSHSRVLAMDAGANDYVTKPFSLRDLLMRIESALRH